jgi:undecaprenyl-diphosphatase
VTWLEPGRRPLVGGVLAAGVGTIGLCLVYLGVHWASDVMAGWVRGVAVGTGAAAATAPGAQPD